jgi:hypothetical protein
MKLKDIRWEAVAIAFAVAFSVSGQAVENAASKEPDSYEFKVLLKNDKFADQKRDAAINTFLERLEQNAESQGAKVKWKKPGERKIAQREVRFLDTSGNLEQAKIYGQGVIFRTRVQMAEPCDSTQADSCMAEKYKVTLKQRFEPGADGALFDMTPNLQKAKAFPAQAAEHDSKFEEDYGWEPGEDGSGAREIKVRKSSSSSVEFEDLQGREQIRDYTTVGDVMAVFDQAPWDEKDVKAGAAIPPTCLIESTKVDVGTFTWKFDSGEKVKCKASFTFWSKVKELDRLPLASEFSYTCGDKKRVFAQAKNAVKNVFKQLINDEFVNDKPDTKTRIAYRCAPN